MPRWEVQFSDQLTRKGKSMPILTVGIDLAKNVFAVHGVNEAGTAQLRQLKVARVKLNALIAALPPCMIGIEARKRGARSCLFMPAMVKEVQLWVLRISRLLAVAEAVGGGFGVQDARPDPALPVVANRSAPAGLLRR